MSNDIKIFSLNLNEKKDLLRYNNFFTYFKLTYFEQLIYQYQIEAMNENSESTSVLSISNYFIIMTNYYNILPVSFHIDNHHKCLILNHMIYVELLIIV